MFVRRFGARSLLKLGVAFAMSLGALTPALASPVVYDFESFADLDVVSNQIAGLSFSHTTVLQAGFSLNEFDFPPTSGSRVVTDDGGAITIDLSSPAFSVGAYFTYFSGLTLVAYDAGNNILGSLSSLFTANLASSGDPGSAPNEFISFADASGRIARVVITGDVGGGSFVMDDLTVDTANAVSEPASIALVLGLVALGSVPGGWLRRRRIA